MDPELLRRLEQQRELLTLPRLGTRDPVGARPLPPQPGRVPAAQETEPHVYGRGPRAADGRPQAFYGQATASDRGVSLNTGVLNAQGGNANGNAQVQIAVANALFGRGVGRDGRPAEGAFVGGTAQSANVNIGADPHRPHAGGFWNVIDGGVGAIHTEESIRAGMWATLFEAGGRVQVPYLPYTAVSGSAGIGAGGMVEARCAPAEQGHPQVPGFTLGGGFLGKFSAGIDSELLNYVPGLPWLLGCQEAHAPSS